MPESARASNRRVLILDRVQSKHAQLVRTAVQAVADEVQLAPECPENVDGWDLALISGSFEGPLWEEAMVRLEPLRARGRVLAYGSDPSRASCARLFAASRLTNFFASGGEVDIEELLVTVRKMLGSDIFGIDKYFSWASRSVRMTLDGTAEKAAVLDEARAFASAVAGPERLIDQFTTTVDEMVTNALFNAPTDPTGRFRFAHLPRTETVRLQAGERVVVELRCDGRRLGVSVADPFGTLTADVLIRHAGQRIGVPSDRRSSGGVGLFSVLTMVSHLVANLSAGHRTEMIALFDIRGGTYRDFVQRGTSFHLFQSAQGPEGSRSPRAVERRSPTPGGESDPVDRSELAQYALSMLGVYSGALVRLGFGQFSEVCLVGCRLLRSVLRADFAAVLMIEGERHSCAASSGLPTATARLWGGHPTVDRLVAECLTPIAKRSSDPWCEGNAEVLGIKGVLLAVPLMDIDTRKGRLGLAVVSGEWVGPDVDLTLEVLKITSTLLAGAMSNCRLRERYEQVYLDLDVARRAAEEHSRAKDRFLARMSHELRTPLNIIIGYSDLILEEIEETEAARPLQGQAELVRPIRSSGVHLLSVVNDVLDISKLHSGEVNLHIEDTDFVELAGGLVAESQVLAMSRNTSISLSLVGPTPPGRTDPRMLRQILYNLLANACKFTENGHISVEVGSSGSGGERVVWFEVTDTGIGIAEENLGRVFQEFVQVDESTTRRHGGTGLGLAVSRALSEWLGGDISVRSQLGKGSTFRLSIRADLARHQPVARGTSARRGAVADVDRLPLGAHLTPVGTDLITGSANATDE
jgi:signal transduction histidine kinase